MKTKLIAIIVVSIIFASSIGIGTYFALKEEDDKVIYGGLPDPDDWEPTDLGDDFEMRHVNDLVLANNQFALDYFKKIHENGENAFFSPWSIITAMGMAYEGAKGETASEMEDVLYYPENDELRWQLFTTVLEMMNVSDEEGVLKAANAFWARDGYPIQQEYSDALVGPYQAEARNLDFGGDPQGAREIINDWVENKTMDKIKDLLPPGSIDASTVLVLTNAIYFKSNWLTQFDKDDTMDRDFWLDGDMKIATPTMYLKADLNFAETDDAYVLELPYENEDMSMMIMLPKNNDLGSFASGLTLDEIKDYQNALNEVEVEVFLPKFKMETKYMMKDDLIDMGMPTAFGGGADFSGINGHGGIYISEVIHQGFVQVDEEGTEAAAATAVVMRESAVMDQPMFRADHPFVFTIQHKETGNILFMGKVADPSN